MKTTTRTITSTFFAATLLIMAIGCGSDQTNATTSTNAQELGTIEGMLASTCNLETVGTTDTCMAPADWKTQVGAICGSNGGTLGVIGYADDCGEGRWRRAKYQCCGAEAPAVPEATCGTAVIGSDDVCMSATDWNNTLQNKCATDGANLTDVSYGETCDGGHKFATYTCCNAPVDDSITTPIDT